MKSNHKNYYLVNGITLFRLVCAAFLILLALKEYLELFKWLLALSFLVDAIDSYLAWKFNVASILGARLSSLADDAIVIAATICLFIFRLEFVHEQWIVFVSLVTLLTIQIMCALFLYNQITSIHTYLGKAATFLQAIFFMMIFFDVGNATMFFYIVACVTVLQLVEEIMLVFILPEWKANVKSFLWVLRHRKRAYKV